MRCILSLVYLLFLSVAAYAQYFSSVPYTLFNTQVAQGSQVNADFNAIVQTGNNVFNDFEAQINALGSQAMPSGIVLFFNKAACPAGWHLSDGTAGTVDLRGRFALATTNGAQVGDTSDDRVKAHDQPVTASPAVISGVGTSTVANGSGFAVVTGAAFGNVTIGNPTTGSHGAETRPKNVALLPCQKL